MDINKLRELAEAALDPELEHDPYDNGETYREFQAAASPQAIIDLLDRLEWQPIETAPRDGTTILITDGRDVEAGFWNDEDDTYRWAFIDGSQLDSFLNGYPEKYITHWMPLPSPPQEQDDE